MPEVYCTSSLLKSFLRPLLDELLDVLSCDLTLHLAESPKPIPASETWSWGSSGSDPWMGRGNCSYFYSSVAWRQVGSSWLSGYLQSHFFLQEWILNVPQMTGSEVSRRCFSPCDQRCISKRVLWAAFRQMSALGERSTSSPGVQRGNSHHAVCRGEDCRAEMIIRASWVVISMLYSQLLHWCFVMNKDKSSRPYEPIYSSVKWLYW